MTNAGKSRLGRALEPAVEEASAAELEELQLDRLARFLAEAADRSPFHRRRARQAGVDLRSIDSLEAFRELPLMRKEDVLRELAERPPFGDLLAAPPEEWVHYVESSGTVGTAPERYVLTRGDIETLTVQEAFGFRWAGVGPGTRVATTFPMTLKAAGRWHGFGVEHAGGVYLPLGTLKTAAKLQYIKRLGVDLIIATPSYLRRLELELEAQGMSAAELRLKALLISAEPFSVEWARQREAAWGARVYEQYASTQRAFAWSCEGGAVDADGRRGLHFLPHLGRCEVIDPETGRPTEPGEEGEVVVTPFGSSWGMPLVRFASGDRVRFLGTESCSCGRAFPCIESGSVYRYDDQIKVKGVNIVPAAIDPLILGDGVVDYEAVVETDERGRETVTVSLEPGAGPVEPEAVAARLKEAIGLNIVVQNVAHPLAAADTGGDVKKRRRWIDRRSN